MTTNSSAYLLDFVDPLFAVVLNLSLGQVLLLDKWIWNLSEASQTFDFWVLVLGYLFVVLSWIGYHRSLRAAPLRSETFPGLLRFVVDVLLLMLYFLLLISFRDFDRVLRLIVCISFFFLVWDVIKAFEYRGERTEGTVLRRGVTTFWLIVFAILWLIHTYWPSDAFFLVLAYLGTILYRVHKQRPSPKHVLRFLGYSWATV